MDRYQDTGTEYVPPLRRWLAILVVVGSSWTVAPAWGGEPVRAQVTEPYLELYTGPGRGFPINHVIERNDQIEILLRKTDWFKVRSSQGKEGWVPRARIEQTMTEAGLPLRLRDVKMDDYRSRRFELGFSGGVLDGDAFMMLNAAYRMNPNLTVGTTLGEASGDFSSSSLYYVSILSEPFPEWRISPFFSLGLGRFHNRPRSTLVSAIETESNMANAALGGRLYLTRRFVVRGDYRRHVVFVDQNRMNEYNELSLGISLFFY